MSAASQTPAVDFDLRRGKMMRAVTLRRRFARRVSAWLWLGLLLAAAAHSQSGGAPAAREGIVQKVLDGDSVRLTGGESVRLLGIDAPESNSRKSGMPAQPFAAQSRDALQQLVGGKKVRLQAGVQPTDTYGRTLAYLHLPDGGDVQLAMLRRGMAMLAAYPPNVSRLQEYAAAQRQAVSARVGLWGDDYFARPVARGLPRSDGPLRVGGRVTSAESGGRAVSLILDDKLKLQIAHPVWHAYFADSPVESWRGKSVVAQGRYQSKSKRMWITHGVMLRVDGLSTP